MKISDILSSKKYWEGTYFGGIQRNQLGSQSIHVYCQGSWALERREGEAFTNHCSCPPSSPSLKTHHSKRWEKLPAVLASDTPTSPLFSGGVINLNFYDKKMEVFEKRF